MRIVSLLPSATEILFALGAGDEVVGVTFECDHPPEARTKQIVSTSAMTPGLTPAEIDREVRSRIAAGEDLYRLDEGALRDLDPDLVVTQDLCAVCAVDLSTVDAARDYLGCDGRVLTVDPATLDDVIGSLLVIGAAVGRRTEAEQLTTELRRRLERITASVAGEPRPRVAVLEWTDPPFNAGHWVPDMVSAAGGQSVLGQAGQRSGRIDWADIATAQPDLIVVAPCGYHLETAIPLATALRDTRDLPPGVPVWAVDADSAVVRPGPRLVDGVEALAAICHPTRVPARERLAAYVGTTPANT
ncbi:MAG TPA: cobalamin-binding protein [Mycobacteriales bacterium]|nr:cobalamin-binding protein [Mycobacteriales bacterium]